jgi:hypothetical protein
MVLRKQRHLHRARLTLLQYLDRLTPCFALAVVDFTQVQHLSLPPAIADHALGFDDDPVAVFLAVLVAGLDMQKHTRIVAKHFLRSRTWLGTTEQCRAFSPPPALSSPWVIEAEAGKNRWQPESNR